MVNLKPQRKYNEDTKTKLLKLTEKFGAGNVAQQIDMPESPLRSWKKVRIHCKGKSGRQPLFPDVEAELIAVFRDSRYNGIMINDIYVHAPRGQKNC